MSDSRQLLRHGTTWVVSRIIMLGVPYALLPPYAHLVGDEGFGVIELMTTVAAFMVPLLLQGQGGALLPLSFDHDA